MKEYLIQLAVVLVLAISIISLRSEEKEKKCPSTAITRVKYSPKKLFSGTWHFVKCLPSVFCNHLMCFTNEIDHEDGFVFSLETTGFNKSSGKKWEFSGQITYTGNGKYKIEGSDEKANVEYDMLGTDYNTYMVAHGCLQNIFGEIESAVWIGSRTHKLEESAKPAVMAIMKTNGFDLDKFINIHDESCEELFED